jgi:hypothetical protein
MHLGRLTVALLLLLAAIDIALLLRSLNDAPERRAPAIGEASLQRVDESATGSLPRDPVTERMPAADGQSNNRPVIDSEPDVSAPNFED